MSNVTANNATPPAATQAAQRKLGVLYVDDEEQALKYFRRGLEREFAVLTAPGVAAAIGVLEQQERAVAAAAAAGTAAPIAVVLSDQRMPGRTGVELLSEVRRRWPSVVRILITAYADIESAVEAVNSGAIYKYIHKPAGLDQLRQTLTDAMAVYRAQMEREALLREKMASLQRLVVEERVRSFAALAGGISHHLLNSMTAMSCFLEETDPAAAAAAAAQAGAAAPAALLNEDPAYLRELWDLAQKERRHLLQIVQDVGRGVLEPRCRPEALEEPVALVRRGVEAAGAGDAVVMEAPPSVELPKIKVDAEQGVRMIRTLVGQALLLDDKARPVRVGVRGAAAVWNAAAVSVTISAPGGNWTEHDIASLFTPFGVVTKDPSNLGLEMLAALYIAYQHGGDVIVHGGRGAAAPGFELLLPLDPAEVKRPELGPLVASTPPPPPPPPPSAPPAAKAA
jgi:two-component system, probable response regulator PhcQ